MNFLLISLTLILSSCANIQKERITLGTISKEQARAKLFEHPYFFYIPRTIKRNSKVQILIVPTNAGSISNEKLSEYENKIKKRTKWLARDFAEKLGVVLLKPAFPRWKSDWRYYTHALDRDTLKTQISSIVRLDLQLFNMVSDLKEKLEAMNMKANKKVLLFGYSASAMFANRFTVLHPEKVLASAVGAPGGWPIAPLSKYKGTSLRYPIGVSDINDVSKIKFNLKEFQGVKQFIFMGDQDTNDSVKYDDSYDPEDRDIIFTVFGKKPLDRWPKIKKIYSKLSKNTKFKLYENTGHTITDEMLSDIIDFFTKSMNESSD